MDWVSDLILQNPNRWNNDIIHSIFVKEEADQIVSIPFPTTNQADKVVWFNENSGIYSVKSGYKLLLDPPNINVNEQKLFKQIWSLIKGEIAIAIWALWFSRNKYVHENKMQSVEEIVTFIRGFGLEYRGCALSLKHPKPRSMVKWMSPPQGWVKVILESDSRLIVQNIQKLSEDYSESRPFTWDVKNLAMHFHSCRIQFIVRKGNQATHAMAVEGLRNEADLLWVEYAPLKVVEVVDSDRQSSRPP
ncbi:reverse transcriptase [Gossypium australe]|uniref:Reverse transcriptase n=1 Tax=Gossypium australe TaxID=47621 RepID=A0A5B6WA22_9ROSI|nr:reverse transcriptase [Gossypium australe]